MYQVRPAVELDGRAVLGVLDLEFLVQFGAGTAADDPETAPGGGDFGIGARDPADEIGCPSVNGASLGITAMVQVDRSNAGIRKCKPEPVGASAGHGLHGIGEAVPGPRIIRVRQPRGVIDTIGRLGPSAVLLVEDPLPHNPMRLFDQRQQHGWKVGDIAYKGFRHCSLPPGKNRHAVEGDVPD